MADTYVPSGLTACFGVYTPVAGVIGATAAAQVAALQAVFTALFGTYTVATGVVTAAQHPDFNKIDAATRAKVITEIAGVFAAIAAAPTA